MLKKFALFGIIVLFFSFFFNNIYYARAGPDYYAWFTTINPTFHDIDYDGYNDCVRIVMDFADNYDGTLEVEARVSLLDKDGNLVDYRSDSWTSEPFQEGEVILYIPPGAPASLYDIDLELYSIYEGYYYYEDHETLEEEYLNPARAIIVVRGNDNRIYFREYFDLSWESWNVLPSGTTIDRPGATRWQKMLYIAVRGTDNGIYFGWVNLVSRNFSGWNRLSGSTLSAPTLVKYGSKIFLVVRGMDNGVYYRLFDCIQNTWEDWHRIPTGSTIDSPGAIVQYGHPPPNSILDTLYLAVRGTDNRIYKGEVRLDFHYFEGWQVGIGSTPSAPTITRDTSNYFPMVSVRGTNNEIFYYEYGVPGPYSGPWRAIPTGSTCDAIGYAAEYRYQHFVVRGNDNKLYHNYKGALGIFMGWTEIGGSTPSAPTLVIREWPLVYPGYTG